MNTSHPFTPADLADLNDRLLSRAFAVVSMREVAAGNRCRDVIGLRHDVDANQGSLEAALEIAEWEAARGYRSTFFMLHTAPYWQRADFPAALDRIARLGHEIGIHTNAVAEALRTGADPDALLGEALDRLRSLGHVVTGVVGHGDKACLDAGFSNDEQFTDCARPSYGAPDRELELGGVALRLAPRALADFGLQYEAVRLGRALYLTDSGGHWLEGQHREPAFDSVCDLFPSPNGMLHVLWHPDWWTEAFPLAQRAAA